MHNLILAILSFHEILSRCSPWSSHVLNSMYALFNLRQQQFPCILRKICPSIHNVGDSCSTVVMMMHLLNPTIFMLLHNGSKSTGSYSHPIHSNTSTLEQVEMSSRMQYTLGGGFVYAVKELNHVTDLTKAMSLSRLCLGIQRSRRQSKAIFFCFKSISLCKISIGMFLKPANRKMQLQLNILAPHDYFQQQHLVVKHITHSCDSSLQELFGHNVSMHPFHTYHQVK